MVLFEQRHFNVGLADRKKVSQMASSDLKYAYNPVLVTAAHPDLLTGLMTLPKNP